jgi:hypothetical protein
MFHNGHAKMHIKAKKGEKINQSAKGIAVQHNLNGTG